MKLVVCHKDKTLSELIDSDDISELMKLLNFHTERLEHSGLMLINEYHSELQIIREFASEENGWECAYAIVYKIATNLDDLTK